MRPVIRPARILLADGDLVATEAVAELLRGSKHIVRVCAGTRGVTEQVSLFRPDLVVMDLPAHDGSLIASAVMGVHSSYRPLLLCTLDDATTQRLPALEAGADACIDKPFTIEELELHMRALLRRAPWLERTIHEVGRLVVDMASHIALFDDEPVTLSSKEFDLLAMLAMHPGAVLSKRTMLEHLWGFDAFDDEMFFLDDLSGFYFV